MSLGELFQTEDHKEGVAAFLEKREPRLCRTLTTRRRCAAWLVEQRRRCRRRGDRDRAHQRRAFERHDRRAHRRPRAGRAAAAGHRVPAHRERHRPGVPLLRGAPRHAGAHARGVRVLRGRAVLGAPFYVMERLHGVVPHEAGGARRHQRRRRAAALCDRFVEVLAAIHAVDFDAVGLGDIGKPYGLPRAPGAPLDRPVAARQGARRRRHRRAGCRTSATRSRRRRRPRSSTATTASAT